MYNIRISLGNHTQNYCPANRKQLFYKAFLRQPFSDNDMYSY